MKLYDIALSGNCHKVRLFLSFLGRAYEKHPIDLAGGELHTAAYLKLNPFGEVPVLVDGDVVLRDSQAILVYLARRYGPEWVPSDAVEEAQVAAWLSTAANDVARGPADLRLAAVFGVPVDRARAEATAARVVQILEDHLATRNWLVGERATIADLAVYPYLASAHEGGVEVGPAVRRWIARLEALPGFLAMPLAQALA